MSSTSGVQSKGDKQKQQKFQSLKINSIYNAKTTEQKPLQRKNTLNRKDGMQPLGKVPTTVRRPLNLGSIKSEHTSSEPAANIVPTGSSGWATKQEESTNQPNTNQRVAPGQSGDMKTMGNNGTSQQVPPAPLAHHMQGIPGHNMMAHHSQKDGKSWATMTHGESAAAQSFLSHQSPLFQHEFPSLSSSTEQTSNTAKTATSSGDGQYGMDSNLRPQREGSWMQGGKGQPTQEAGNSQGAGPAQGHQSFPPYGQSIGPDGVANNLAHSGAAAGQGGPSFPPPQNMIPTNIIPPHYRTVFPAFMSVGGGFGPAFHDLTRPPRPDFSLPPPGHPDGKFTYPPPSMPARQQQSSRKLKPEECKIEAIIKEEDLKKMEEIGTDLGWALNEEVDYDKKLNFDDDDDRPLSLKAKLKSAAAKKVAEKTPDKKEIGEKIAEKLKENKYTEDTRKSWQPTGNRITTSNADYRATRYQVDMTDEEWEEKKRQTNQEIEQAAIRANKLKEEEERRFNESVAAASKYAENENKEVKKTDIEDTSKDKSKGSDSNDDKSSSRGQSSTPTPAVVKETEFTKPESPNNLKKGRDQNNSYSRPNNTELAPRYQKLSTSSGNRQQDTRRNTPSPYHPSEGKHNAYGSNSSVNRRDSMSSDRDYERTDKYGPSHSYDRDNRDKERYQRNRNDRVEDEFDNDGYYTKKQYSDVDNYAYDRDRNDDYQYSKYRERPMDKPRDNYDRRRSSETDYRQDGNNDRGGGRNHHESEDTTEFKRPHVPERQKGGQRRGDYEKQHSERHDNVDSHHYGRSQRDSDRSSHLDKRNSKESFSTAEERKSFSWAEDVEITDRKPKYMDSYKDDRRDTNMRTQKAVPGPVTREMLRASEANSDYKPNLMPLVKSDKLQETKKAEVEKPRPRPVVEKRGPASNENVGKESQSSNTDNKKELANVTSCWDTNRKKQNEEPKEQKEKSPEKLKEKSPVVEKKEVVKEEKPKEPKERQDDRNRVRNDKPRRGGRGSASHSGYFYYRGGFRGSLDPRGRKERGPPGRGPPPRRSNYNRCSESEYSEDETSDELRDDRSMRKDSNRPAPRARGGSGRYQRGDRGRDYYERDYYDHKYDYYNEPPRRGRPSHRGAVKKQGSYSNAENSEKEVSTQVSKDEISKSTNEKKAYAPVASKPYPKHSTKYVGRKSDNDGPWGGKRSTGTGTEDIKGPVTSQSIATETNDDDWETANEGSEPESKLDSKNQDYRKNSIRGGGYKQTSGRYYDNRASGSGRQRTTYNKSESYRSRNTTTTYKGEPEMEKRKEEKEESRTLAKGTNTDKDFQEVTDKKSSRDVRRKSNERVDARNVPRKYTKATTNSVASSSARTKSYQSSAVPPRFAKNNRIEKEKPEVVISPVKEPSAPIIAPPPITNAWDKPITDKFRASSATVTLTKTSVQTISTIKSTEPRIVKSTEKLEQTVEVVAPISAAAALAESFAPIAKPVERSMLDGSTPPVETIIFENTKFKTVPPSEQLTKLKQSYDKTDVEADGGLSSLPSASTVGRINLNYKNEDLGDSMKLDFTYDESDFVKLTDDSSKATKPHMEFNAQSSSDVELNYKIASVKNVWDDGGVARMEQSDDNPLVSSSFSPSFVNQQQPDVDTSSNTTCYVSVDASGQIVMENVPSMNHTEVMYGSMPQIQSTINAYNGSTICQQAIGKQTDSSNVCKVKPQPQGSNSNMIMPNATAEGMMSNAPPLCSPTYSSPTQSNQATLTAQGGTPAAAVLAAATAHFQASAQYPNAVSIPSPPALLYNSSQQIPPSANQTAAGTPTGLYQAFQFDGSQVLGTGQGGGSRSQYGQYPTSYGLGQTSGFNQQSVFVQHPAAPPPSGVPPDMYTSQVQPYRIQAYNTQQMNTTPNTVLMTSTSNSNLMTTGTGKNNAHHIGPIGTKGPYTPQQQVYLPQYDANQMMNPNFIASNQIMAGRPASNVPGAPPAMQSSSYYTSASPAAGQSFFQGNSSIQGSNTVGSPFGIAAFNAQPPPPGPPQPMQNYPSQVGYNHPLQMPPQPPQYRQPYTPKSNAINNQPMEMGKNMAMQNHEMMNSVFQAGPSMSPKPRIAGGKSQHNIVAHMQHGMSFTHQPPPNQMGGIHQSRNAGLSGGTNLRANAQQFPLPIQRPASSYQGGNMSRHQRTTRNNPHQQTINMHQQPPPPAANYYPPSSGGYNTKNHNTLSNAVSTKESKKVDSSSKSKEADKTVVEVSSVVNNNEASVTTTTTTNATTTGTKESETKTTEKAAVAIVAEGEISK